MYELKDLPSCLRRFYPHVLPQKRSFSAAADAADHAAGSTGRQRIPTAAAGADSTTEPAAVQQEGHAATSAALHPHKKARLDQLQPAAAAGAADDAAASSGGSPQAAAAAAAAATEENVGAAAAVSRPEKKARVQQPADDAQEKKEKNRKPTAFLDEMHRLVALTFAQDPLTHEYFMQKDPEARNWPPAMTAVVQHLVQELPDISASEAQQNCRQ
jgi:hypothetical protein